MNITLKQLLEDPLWIVMEVNMKLRQFLMRFENSNQYYRLLSQSEYRFGRESNRSFFKKSFSHGFYRCSIEGERVSYILFLKLKSTKGKSQKAMELLVRSKRLMFSPTKVYYPSEINETDRLLLSSMRGRNEYRKILGFRKKSE